ncbi:fimbria/pilus outer membrane usher protein [Escherichia coli]|nr:fimbria/pilus outer membrane usher protein [Escherichia coli]
MTFIIVRCHRGPFTINDIYAAGNSGDLQVTIKEADGSTQIFLPYPIRQSRFLQREGHTRYSITAGENTVVEMRSRKNAFSRVHYSTAFRLAGQYMVERNWRIVIVLFNFGIGKKHGGALGRSVCGDMTQANSTLPDDSQHDGQSVRFLYNKSLNESGTNIQLVGYRYSTSGYF